ncbi:MAG: hypothetical protein FWG15_07625 [Propionibacteriaceae bacterium]|nr:hypothetical protein [Propionibacteriaceae bacterium]
MTNIRLKEGTPVVYLETVTRFPGQEELVVAKGQKYRIVDVDVSGSYPVWTLEQI